MELFFYAVIYLKALSYNCIKFSIKNKDISLTSSFFHLMFCLLEHGNASHKSVVIVTHLIKELW